MVRRILFSLVLFVVCSITAMAQLQQDVIHLKNGSMIKGMITELIPNETVRISTKDGSIFVFQMSEVEKITNEQLPPEALNTTVKLKPKYKGFMDIAYTVGNYPNTNRIGFTTSHGVQISQFLFLGVGAGVKYYNDADVFAVPLFANSRVDFNLGSLSIYADAKVGYSPSDISGLYGSTGLGVRFPLGKRLGLNVGLAYEGQRTELYFPEIGLFNIALEGYQFKVGIDF